MEMKGLEVAAQDLTPIINLINSRFDATDRRFNAVDSRLDDMSSVTRLFDPKRCHGQAEAIAEIKEIAGRALERIESHEAVEDGVDKNEIKFERRHGLKWQVIGIVSAVILGIASLTVAAYTATRPAQAQQVTQQTTEAAGGR